MGSDVVRAPMWLRIGSLAVAALVVVPACALVVSTDGLAGDDTADGSDGRSIGSADAGSMEAQSRDVAAATDGGYCSTLQPPPTLCEDFDRGPPSSWVPLTASNSGAISSDTGQAKSLPRSRRATLPAALPGAVCQYRAEVRTLDVDYTSYFRVEHDVFLGHPSDTGGVPGSSAAEGLTFSAADGSGACDVYFNFGVGSTAVGLEPHERRDLATQYPLSILVAPRVWEHVAVEVRNPASGASEPRLSVWVNGALALDSVPIAADRQCRVGRLRSVGVGFYCYRGSNDVELRADNIVASTK